MLYARVPLYGSMVSQCLVGYWNTGYGKWVNIYVGNVEVF